MRIGILVLPRVQLLDVAGPADVFAEAARQLGKPRAYQVEVLAPGVMEVKTSSGVRLGASRTLPKPKNRYDTLLVAGSPWMNDVYVAPETLDWLRMQAGQVRRICSVCTGAFALAMAGILTGKRVTTHWNSAGRLAAEFPSLAVDPDRIYVKDGNVYTSAGVTAGMDLALSLVEEDHGRELALQVARELLMYLKRPGGQSQFSAYLASQLSGNTVTGRIQEFVLNNLDADLAIPALAARANMSERNFSRVFKTASGCTPAEYVERARLEAALRLLESEDLPLKRLAAKVGYPSVDVFRRAFHRRLGVSPADYRRQFQ